MQVNLKKNLRSHRIIRALKSNLKKRKIFQEKLKKNIKENK